eukprot:CAMPEP_0202913864 /NCGR_PEP_ID=MMETSP1392-20130828/61649_1 /ASSEMBLY_ACC=CAM_ASM_000868 /TAXON_ID=225041 /ORGANISM="Chlamydomonas chlamydogama, Strain SAG 11-48b" /LENGTH=302 /DNA_ID=CAMNT_0049605293 /DNA_START=34 /DNA_END=939 /DNA_ORIENTATION=+
MNELKRKEEYKAIQHQVKQKIESARLHLIKLLNPEELRPESVWTPVVLEEKTTFYKVVAAGGDSLVSVFDGSTKYRLAKWTHTAHGAASWPPVYACFYAYETLEEAVRAKFPLDSCLLDSPKVLIKVEAQGCAYLHAPSRTWALSQVYPTDIITHSSSSAALDVHYALNGRQAQGSAVPGTGQALTSGTHAHQGSPGLLGTPLSAAAELRPELRVTQHTMGDSGAHGRLSMAGPMRGVRQGAGARGKPAFRPAGSLGLPAARPTSSSSNTSRLSVAAALKPVTHTTKGHTVNEEMAYAVAAP